MDFRVVRRGIRGGRASDPGREAGAGGRRGTQTGRGDSESEPELSGGDARGDGSGVLRYELAKRGRAAEDFHG